MKIFNQRKALVRLEHVKSNLSEWIESKDVEFWNDKLLKVDNIEWASIRLQSYCIIQIILNQFQYNNLNETKNYAYNYAKLQYVMSQSPYDYLGQEYAYENRAFEGLWFLLSNHKPLIEWYSNLAHIFSQSADNPKSEQFFTKQFFIALRGDWKLLQERCEKVLADPPTSGRGKNYLIDHTFYLSLSQGDIDGMINAISQLLETKTFNRRQRMDLESGYTKDLIDTPATLYTKLAWYHGYQIQIESDYIPKEWLEMTPLENYQDEFEFMKKYSI